MLNIIYISGSDVTERIISGTRVIKDDLIDAHCHMRDEGRSFRLSNILSATEIESGKKIDDLWEYLGIKGGDTSLRITRATHPIWPEIDVLVSFAWKINGLRKRELTHLLNFIKNNAEVSGYSDEELKEWIRRKWRINYEAYRNGDRSEYEVRLKAIPKEMLPTCKACALMIAGGSGRKPITQDTLDEINTDYGE